MQPFASLIHRVPSHCPRLLLNLESVGEVEPSRTRFGGGGDAEGFDFEGTTGRKEGIRDVRFLGSSDEGVRTLCRVLGWEEELVEMMKREHAVLAGVSEAEVEEGESEESEASKDEEQAGAEEKREAVIEAVIEKVEDEDVADLAKDVERVQLDEPSTADAEPAPSPPKATL